MNSGKMNKITLLFRHGNFGLADLKINIGYFIRHKVFSIKMDLKIGKKKLISDEKSQYFMFSTPMTAQMIKQRMP